MADDATVAVSKRVIARVLSALARSDCPDNRCPCGRMGCDLRAEHEGGPERLLREAVPLLESTARAAALLSTRIRAALGMEP